MAHSSGSSLFNDSSTRSARSCSSSYIDFSIHYLEAVVPHNPYTNLGVALSRSA
jgi:hypothetical protein